MSSIFRIKFDEDVEHLNNDYERLDDYEKQIISHLDVESFFDYEELNGSYVCFIITSHLEIKAYQSILISNSIKYTIKDLSDFILTNRIDLEEELKSKILPTNQIKFNIFVEWINHWISENLDIDIILDRISKVGIDKLKKVEKNFLKNYNT